MKQVLLKTIVIILGKLTRNRVLRGEKGFRGALKGKNGVRQNHVGRRRKPHLSDPPRPIVIPKIVTPMVKFYKTPLIG